MVHGISFIDQWKIISKRTCNLSIGTLHASQLNSKGMAHILSFSHPVRRTMTGRICNYLTGCHSINRALSMYEVSMHCCLIWT